MLVSMRYERRNEHKKFKEETRNGKNSTENRTLMLTSPKALLTEGRGSRGTTEASEVSSAGGEAEIDALNPGGGVFQRLSNVKPKK